jgi:hypothetical protein
LIDLGASWAVGQREVAVDGVTRHWPDMDMPEIDKLYGVADHMLRPGRHKYAAICGHNLMLHQRGQRPDPLYETLGGTITDVIDQGPDLLS